MLLNLLRAASTDLTVETMMSLSFCEFSAQSKHPDLFATHRAARAKLARLAAFPWPDSLSGLSKEDVR